MAPRWSSFTQAIRFLLRVKQLLPETARSALRQHLMERPCIIQIIQRYSSYSGEELRAAAEAEATRADFQSFTSGNGRLHNFLRGIHLEPGQSYSCIMVAENENLDVSDALKLTATTNNRVLNKNDFSIGETKFTYAGNQANTWSERDTDFGKQRKKPRSIWCAIKRRRERNIQEASSENRRQPGVYGVFVSTKSETTGIDRPTRSVPLRYDDREGGF